MSSATDRLQSLYASNRPPSPQEASVAAESIQLCSEKLQVVDTHITALERELEELKAQQSIIEGERRRYVDILSARRLLPPEIVGRFMELACVNDNDDKLELSQSLGTHQRLLPFMLVSREWYRTACGVANLWTELEMDLRNFSSEEIPEIILKATNQSARAAEILKIAFSAAAPARTQIVDFIHSLISRLELFILRLYIDSISDLQILDTLFPPSSSSSTLLWPTLHTLQISIRSGREIAAESGLSIPSANFPLLRTAAMSSPEVIFPSYQMPCANLMRLDLGPLNELTYRKYVPILGACTNLRSLRLRMQHQFRTDETDNIPVITLPHLTHLQVESSVPGETGRFLPLLRLPSLQSCIYTISAPWSWYMDILRKFTALFVRSGCSESMEYLELNFGYSSLDCRMDELYRPLMALPRLTALKLSNFRMEMRSVEACLPRIRELMIKHSREHMDDALHSFAQYLDYRFNASPDIPLKVRLQFVDTPYTLTPGERLDSIRNKFGSSLDLVID
ncbi:hypothetical protein EST38_g4618 [Candolleomyces aberdarensis]|uniref:F-box domain-containing protein n=1 Tax=Candolleomyces aberdarensis TaxID=2316362 RepID=A0A4V1Q487_9AGAR|nr:hypothetical protein EST38_g4618 [Candolleomyces aberdarensis]